MNAKKYIQLVLYGISVIIQASPLSALGADNKDSLPTIIAIGDMHGDYEAYRSLTLAAGLMDRHGNWAGGTTIFVQTGDIPDRGPSTRKIIESLQRLEKQAPEVGGRVIPLVGNHEAMNMVRDLRYVHPGEYKAFADVNSEATRDVYYLLHKAGIEAKARELDPQMSAIDIRLQWDANTPLGKVEHEAVWSPKGRIGSWVANNLLVAKVGPYLFAHGGFSQEFSSISLEDINTTGQTALIEQDWSKDSILRHSLGPLWYRGNVLGREDIQGFSKEKELSTILDAYDATHVIVGHTYTEGGIRASLNGRLFQIDTGASAHYYGGVPSYLRIQDGEFFAHSEGKVEHFENGIESKLPTTVDIRICDGY